METRDHQIPEHVAVRAAAALLDVEGSQLGVVLSQVVDRLVQQGRFSTHEADLIAAKFDRGVRRLPADLGHGVGVLRFGITGLSGSGSALVRLAAPVEASDGARIRWLWVTLGPSRTAGPSDEAFEPFGWMLSDDRFNAEVVGAASGDEVMEAYERYLAFVETPPQQLDEIPAELTRTGTPFGGLIADIKRRAPHYLSDFTDGVHPKSLAAVFYLFFACLAPAIAFGGLTTVLTNGEIGAIETIVATAIGGVIYALFAAMPLTILGSIGPVLVFIALLYESCQSLGIAFLPTYAWIGLWTMVFLLVLAATDASVLIRFFTRFTDEIFALLVSLIFIAEAVKDIVSTFSSAEGSLEGALLSLVLALGTFYIAHQLSRLRRSPYLLGPLREVLADFGPTVAIVAMTGAYLCFKSTDVTCLNVPSHFATTSGRAWLTPLFDVPPWVMLGSSIPALLLAPLIFINQNITIRLITSPEYRLKKGPGYHLDLSVIALLIGLCSLFGLPWLVAATVRSLNHVRSLATVETHGGHESIVSVRETRLVALTVHIAVGCSLLMLGLLRQVPMPVVFGLFLFMGVASMRNNQLVERLQLWLTDPAQYPPTHYLRRVRRRTVHLFTLVQALCLIVLWVVLESPIGLVFPFFVAMLVPVRLWLDKIFDGKDLAFLDASELATEEQFRDLD